MTTEELFSKFQELEDRIIELEGEKFRLECKIEDLESLCSGLENRITEIGWRT
jgi:predicted nuclease with TOPRIM domain